MLLLEEESGESDRNLHGLLAVGVAVLIPVFLRLSKQQERQYTESVGGSTPTHRGSAGRAVQNYCFDLESARQPKDQCLHATTCNLSRLSAPPAAAGGIKSAQTGNMRAHLLVKATPPPRARVAPHIGYVGQALAGRLPPPASLTVGSVSASYALAIFMNMSSATLLSGFCRQPNSNTRNTRTRRERLV